MTKCKNCGEELKERDKKSKRLGEYLLICLNGHKWQARFIEGHLHLYRTNWTGHRGEGRKVAAITISPSQKELMESHSVKQQKVFEMGIDILRNKQQYIFMLYNL